MTNATFLNARAVPPISRFVEPSYDEDYRSKAGQAGMRPTVTVFHARAPMQYFSTIFCP